MSADYCYLIQEVGDPSGPVKIGYASSPHRRLSGIQTGNSRPLHLIAIGPEGKKLEAEFKRVWEVFAIRGEWFRYHPNMVQWLTDRGCSCLCMACSPNGAVSPAATRGRFRLKGSIGSGHVADTACNANISG